MSNETKITDAVDAIGAATTGIAVKTLERTTATLTNGIGLVSATAGQAQAKLQDSSKQAAKTAEGLASFSQGNVEALTQSTQIWAVGLQDLSKQVAASMQTSFQENITAFKALGSVKSLKEAIDLQSALARTALEKTMSESGRLTQASLKLTEQALAPLVLRVKLAGETFGKAA